MMNKKTKIKAIPTAYNGIMFRSKLEVACAKFFDNNNIKWVYEAEGVKLDDIYYLPDFWLPDSKTFFEAKGIFDELDFEKIKRLWKKVINKKIDIIIGQYAYWERGNYKLAFAIVKPSPQNILSGYFRNDVNYIEIDFTDIYLTECDNCGKRFFMTYKGGNKCRCCGAWEDCIETIDINPYFLDDNDLHEMNIKIPLKKTTGFYINQNKYFDFPLDSKSIDIENEFITIEKEFNIDTFIMKKCPKCKVITFKEYCDYCGNKIKQLKIK